MFSINYEAELVCYFGEFYEEKIEFEQTNFYYRLNSDKPRKFTKNCYDDKVWELRPKSRLNMGQII